MNSQPSTTPAQPTVQLHIDRLVVDESLLAGGRSGALQAAMETELARLLAERGLTPVTEGAIPSLTARNIQIADQTRPAQLGRQIAHSVYATIGATNSLSSKGQPDGGTRL
jgi:hypothetical protein